MNPILSALSSFLLLIEASMPDLVERLPAATVQKFRDAQQDLQTALAAPDAAVGLGLEAEHLDAGLGMPPEIAGLLDEFRAEMARKAAYDEKLDQHHGRIVDALDRLAAGVEKITAPMRA